MKFVLFIVFIFIPYAIMSYIYFMFRSAIYAIIMLWSALCLFLVLNLTICRVGVTGGIRTVFRYAGMVHGYKNSFRYMHFLPVMRGRQQVVTDLIVLAFLPVRIWYRSSMDIWAMKMDWIFCLYNMALNTDLII